MRSIVASRSSRSWDLEDAASSWQLRQIELNLSRYVDGMLMGIEGGRGRLLMMPAKGRGTAGGRRSPGRSRFNA